MFAGYLAQQSAPHPIGPGQGALAGLLAGFVGSIVWLVVALALDVVIAPLQERLVDEMIRSARDMPPEVRDWLETLADSASSPFRIAAGLLFHLFAGAIFSTLGGLLAAAYFRRDVPPALGGDYIPPLPPQ